MAGRIGSRERAQRGAFVVLHETSLHCALVGRMMEDRMDILNMEVGQIFRKANRWVVVVL